MKKKILHYTKEFLLFMLVMTLFANALSWYKSQELNKGHLPSLPTKLINNSDYVPANGEALLVHFWATWCPTCKLEAANIEQISKHYSVVTLAVNSGTNFQINEYLKKNNLEFNVINDKDGYFAKQFNISAYPTTFIYDKNHNLIFSEVGYTSTLGLYLRMWWANL